MSLAKYMYAYVNTPVIRFNPCSKFVSNSDFNYARDCSGVSTTDMLSVHLLHVTSSLPMVSLLCLHVSHRSSPTRRTACLTPTPRQGAVCAAHTACSTLHGTMAHISSVTPLLKAVSPQTVIGSFFAFFGNLGQFSAAWWLPYHVTPRVLLLFLLMSAYSVRWDLFQQSLAKELWGNVFRGRHFCVTVPCLYHL